MKGAAGRDFLTEIKFTLSQGYKVAHAILIAHLRNTLPVKTHAQLAQLVSS
jgi:hypothetical protein